jgi:hypothetical protein
MRKLSILIVAILAAACLASPAMAADPVKALTKRVTALEKQVRTLRSELDTARTRLSAVESTTDCLGPVFPLAQYGGVFNGVPEGYVYGVGSTPQFFMTTGLDFVPDTTGLVPGVDYDLMMTWSGSCASTPPDSARVVGPLRRATAGDHLTRLGWSQRG